MKKIFSIFICLVCFGCSSSHDSKPKILVTIPPYAGFVKSLVGNKISVEIFVPPGSNPHTYEPSPDQIKHFTEAKVWFRIGDPIENKMVSFLQQRNVQIVDLSKDWDVLTMTEHVHGEEEPSHEEKDLHLWMNPNIVAEQVEEMTLVLSQYFPEIATTIKDNSIKLKAALKQLDTETSSRLIPFQGRYLLVSHPALGYYCLRYGLHQLSVEVEGKDPLPQDIAHLMNELKDHPVPVILLEPQYNKKGALLIAEKLHIPHEEIDPYAEDYFGMLNHLTKIIVKYYGHSNS
jgi:zinc transport system substrate-binding protein